MHVSRWIACGFREGLRVTLFCGAIVWLIPARPAVAQTSTSTAEAAPYTLTTTVRRVITDVTVTDDAGNPVHGLKQNNFMIFEDKQPQQIRSFDEQTAATNALPVAADLPKGVYSNIALQQLPQTTNVLLIDPFDASDNLQQTIQDQMHLRIQLLHAVDQLAGKHAIAIFAINSGTGSIPLQGFTTDRGLLRAAIDHELPRITAKGGDLPEHRADAVATLSAISIYLSRIPGHKNLIWFSSNFPFTEQQDGLVGGFTETNRDEIRHLYNQLSLDRVAVFPVDDKGLEIGQAPPIGEQTAMDQIAAATGGMAFANRNDVGGAAVQAVQDGSDYYTLTYAPSAAEPDDHFHTIHVDVVGAGGPYTLHYRSGYIAYDMKTDASMKLDEARLQKTNDALDTLASGGKLTKTHVNARELNSTTDYNAPTPAEATILFEARIVPASEVKGWQVLPAVRDAKGKLTGNPNDPPYVIEYSALSKDLRFVPSPAGREHAELIAAAVAYNDSGVVLGTAIDRAQLNFDPAQMEIANRLGTPLRQQIRLPKGKMYLSLSLIDNVTGKTGSLDIPFDSRVAPGGKGE
jgi:VWFA-related protein